MPSRYLNSIWIFAVFVVVLIAQLALSDYATDDAYIHFRIASNFLDFGHPYFNHNAHVMSTSSSLWTLVLTGLFSIAGVSVSAVSVLNGLLAVLAANSFRRFYLGEVTQPTPSGKGLVVFLVTILVLSTSTIQLMEIPLAFWLLGEALIAYQKRRSWCGVLFSLAVFVRLELLVFLVVFGLHALWRKRLPVGKFIGFAVLGALPLICFNLFYFETLIPQTVHAKSQIYSLRSWETFVLMTFAYYGEYLSTKFSILIVIHLCCCLFALLALANMKKYSQSSFLLLVISGTLIALSYLFVGVFLFPWYQPLYLLPIVLGIYGLLASSKWALSKLAIFLILLPVCFVGGRNIFAGLSIQPEYFEEFLGGAKVRRYLQVGEALRPYATKAKLMAAEIGGVGIAYQGYVYDAAGLASPEALEYRRKASGMKGDIPIDYVEAKEPDFVVGIDLHVEQLQAQDFGEAYEQIRTPVFLADDAARTKNRRILKSEYLNVFIRRDANLDINDIRMRLQ